jgi:hypothetical protein
LLYVFASFSARRDAREIQQLRERIEELEQAQLRSPSGSLSQGFVPPIVPIPGFGSSSPLGPASSLGVRQPPSSPLHTISPSASGSNLSLPPRQFSPPQQMGGPRPPYQS